MRRIWLASALALALGCARDSNTTTITCPVGAAYCSGVCSSLSTDRANCGACGHACASGEACEEGACTDPVATCDGGLEACGGECVNAAVDRANCGACGHVCAIHEDCQGGACALRCQADLALCGSACVNVASDPRNCGSCGHECAAGAACSAGVCVSACAGALALCGGTCVDTAWSSSNCGACGNVCPSGTTCAYGSCQCPSGGTRCGESCVATATDPANCGACGNTCASGVCQASTCLPVCDKTLCGTSCVDLQTDLANCGACGQACVNGETCDSGSCVCAAGSQACGTSAACVDTATDADNCGACDNACPVGQTCEAGACVADTTAFRMLGGDAGHGGLNAGETGVPPLALAWTAKGAGGRGPAVIEGGRVLSLGGTRLWAHEVSNGAELWSYNFGQSTFGIGWPAASGGKVYVATSNSYSDTWLRQLDRATGAVGFKVGFSSQWEQYWSPIVVDDVVYTNGGAYGGLYGFDAANFGAQLFFTSLDQYDEWSPAFFDGKVFTYVMGKVRAHDPATGVIQATLDVGWTWNGYDMRTAPAFGDTYGYVISPPDVVAFDPATLTRVWTVNDAYTAYPAVASGVVYALSNGNLHALDAATGARKWMFVGDDRLQYPPVIAAGYLYVASDANVYAVDVTTHQQVWSAPVGGRLAVGAGTLFVSRASDGTLYAFRLTR